MDSINFKREWWMTIRELPVQVSAEVMRAVMEYVFLGASPSLKAKAQIAFDFLKREIDNSKHSVASQFAKNGWEKRREKPPKCACDAHAMRIKNDYVYSNNKDINSIEYDNTKYVDRDNSNCDILNIMGNSNRNTISPTINVPPMVHDTDQKKLENSVRRFSRPSVEEVRAYCQERHNNIDAQEFIDYYESCGWTVGRNKPMKNWQAAVRTWETKRKYSNRNAHKVELIKNPNNETNTTYI